MEIYFYELSNQEEKIVRERFSKHNLVCISKPFTPQTLPSPTADIISSFTDCKFTNDVLAQLPKLKLIATRTTGYDHISLEGAKSRGIAVANVPDYGQQTVAEFAFSLILGLSRKLYPAIKRVREHGAFNTDGLRGFDLSGKTLGVIGTGRIGRHVVGIARGFSMSVLAYDPFPNKDLAESGQVKYVSLEELLAQSDIVSLHVPYMPETHHLLNKDNLKKIKRGAIVINTARGGLIETSALVEALHSGQVGGAGLDVLEEEGFVKDEMEMLSTGHPSSQQLKTVLADHELVYMDNVIITPHNAFNTTEALRRILDTTLYNIEQFIEGSPVNLIK